MIVLLLGRGCSLRVLAPAMGEQQASGASSVDL